MPNKEYFTELKKYQTLYETCAQALVVKDIRITDLREQLANFRHGLIRIAEYPYVSARASEISKIASDLLEQIRDPE